MSCKANFNILKQCPEVYIYIFSVVTSALVALKLCDKLQFLWILGSGTITTIILMGILYCSWPFKFITWFFSLIFILISIVNIIIFFFATPEQLKEIEK